MFTWSGDLKGFGAAGKTFVAAVVPFWEKKTKNRLILEFMFYVNDVQTGKDLLRFPSDTMRCLFKIV